MKSLLKALDPAAFLSWRVLSSFVLGAILGTLFSSGKPRSSPLIHEQMREEEEEEVIPKSQIMRKTDPLTNKATYYLSIGSNSSHANSIGVEEKASLIIRCKSDDTEIFISTPEFVSDNSQFVKFKFDSGPIIEEYWHGGSGGTSLFPAIPSITKLTLQNLSSHSKYIVNYEPYQKIPVSSVFDLQAHRQDIKKMLSNCSD